jgi:hypothetical protein
MKYLLFIFITLITIANVSYASFPVVESNAMILAIESEDDEPSLLEAILMGVLVVSILGFATYFLFRACRDNIRWVKILTYILLVLFLLFLILVLIGMAIFSGGPMM